MDGHANVHRIRHRSVDGYGDGRRDGHGHGLLHRLDDVACDDLRRRGHRDDGRSGADGGAGADGRTAADEAAAAADAREVNAADAAAAAYAETDAVAAVAVATVAVVERGVRSFGERVLIGGGCLEGWRRSCRQTAESD